MKAVLETRFVGMAPDASGHPLAPPELVYLASEPRRSSFLARLAGLSFPKRYALFCLVGSVMFCVAAIVQLVSRYSAL